MKYAAMAMLLLVSVVAAFLIYKSLSDGDGIRAICKDGTISKSKTNKGTCSRHGGVHQWTIGER